MTRDSREKASDVFRNTEHMFSEKVGFEKAFPQVDELKVVVTQQGEGVSNWNCVSHYGKNAGEYIDCRNPLCYNGGFSLGGILRAMVQQKQTHFEDKYIFCQGYEGSPKGRRKYGSCMNSFEIVVDIKYKPAAVARVQTGAPDV